MRRERYPRHWLQRKLLVSDPDMHHGTCVTHVPRCMSGSLNRGSGGKRSRRMRNPQFYVSGKRPVQQICLLVFYLGQTFRESLSKDAFAKDMKNAMEEKRKVRCKKQSFNWLCNLANLLLRIYIVKWWFTIDLESYASIRKCSWRPCSPLLRSNTFPSANNILHLWMNKYPIHVKTLLWCIILKCILYIKFRHIFQKMDDFVALCSNYVDSYERGPERSIDSMYAFLHQRLDSTSKATREELML